MLLLLPAPNTPAPHLLSPKFSLHQEAKRPTYSPECLTASPSVFRLGASLKGLVQMEVAAHFLLKGDGSSQGPAHVARAGTIRPESPLHDRLWGVVLPGSVTTFPTGKAQRPLGSQNIGGIPGAGGGLKGAALFYSCLPLFLIT